MLPLKHRSRWTAEKNPETIKVQVAVVCQNSPRLTTRSKPFLDSTDKPATPQSITTIFAHCHRLCAVAKVTSLQPFARSVHRLSGGRLSASMLAARIPKQHCVFLLIGTRHGLLSGCQTRQNRAKKNNKKKTQVLRNWGCGALVTVVASHIMAFTVRTKMLYNSREWQHNRHFVSG